MSKAAVVSKPNIAAALSFAEKDAGKAHSAIKSGSAMEGAGQATGGAPEAVKQGSGQVPEGDMRLTANIRRDIHKRLKDAASQRQYETGKKFTVGELIEELVERYIPQ